jgi:hypothetical protein
VPNLTRPSWHARGLGPLALLQVRRGPATRRSTEVKR